MSKELTIAELAADLPTHLADVKNGDSLTIVEEGKPIAEITPTLIRRGVRYPFRNFSFRRASKEPPHRSGRDHRRRARTRTLRKEVRRLIAYIDASVLVRI